MIVSTTDSTYEESPTDIQSRTDLDSHANMPVVGKHAHIFRYTGKTASVSAFSPDYDPLKTKIVDAAVLYQCAHTGTAYLLVIMNALYVPSMNNNLISPFILRLAGIDARDTPKIQLAAPGEADHALTIENNLRIPLQLYGIFSYFPTSKPTLEEVEAIEDVYLLTPEAFNPHDTAYALNEDAILDWEGNIVEPHRRQRFLLSEIEGEDEMEAPAAISSAESDLIDRLIHLRVTEQDDINVSGVDSTLSNIDSIALDDRDLFDRLRQRRDLGMLKASLGSMDAPDEQFLLHETGITDSDTNLDDDSYDNLDDDALADVLGDASVFQELVDRTLERGENNTAEMEIDDLFVSSASANPSRGVEAKHLAKIWRIDLEKAEKTIELTTQRLSRSEGDRLSRNYGTSDRMLRFKRILTYFFMDTFYATKEKGKSSRGHTCCQLFVTDKGFVYVVPMRSKSEVLNAVKQFAREVGAPEAIISDAAGEQSSEDLKKFCQSIGTSLRHLEEGTPWSNLAELYIGIIKESVRRLRRTLAFLGLLCRTTSTCTQPYCFEPFSKLWKQSTHGGI